MNSIITKAVSFEVKRGSVSVDECPPDHLANTPERHLWLAVVNTYFDDIKRVSFSQALADQILREAGSESAEIVCELAGVDYLYFVDRIIQLHRVASYERRWNA